MSDYELLKVAKLKREIEDKLNKKRAKDSDSYFKSRLPGRILELLLHRKLQETLPQMQQRLHWHAKAFFGICTKLES